MGSTSTPKRPRTDDYSSLPFIFQTEVDKYTSEYEVLINRSQSVTATHAKASAQFSTGTIPQSCRQKIAALKSGPFSQASLDADLTAKALEIDQWLATRWIAALAEEKAGIAEALKTLKTRASTSFTAIVKAEMVLAGFEEAFYLLQDIPLPDHFVLLFAGQCPFTKDQISEEAQSYYDVCMASVKVARDNLSTNSLFIRQKVQIAIQEAAKKAAERQKADTLMGEASVAPSEPAVRLVIARETEKFEARLKQMDARLSHMATMYLGPPGFPTDGTTGKQIPDKRHQQQPQQGAISRGGGGRREGQGRNLREQHTVPTETQDPAMVDEPIRGRGRGRGMGRGRGPPRKDRGRGGRAGRGAS